MSSACIPTQSSAMFTTDDAILPVHIIVITSAVCSAICTAVLKNGHTFLVGLFRALWRNALITKLGLCTLLGVPALPGALQVAV